MSAWSLRFTMWYMAVLLTQPQNRFLFLYPFHIADIAVMGALGFHVLACGQGEAQLLRMGRATVLCLTVLILATISNYTGPLQAVYGWNPYMDILFKNALVLLLVEAACTSIARVWMVQATLAICTLWWIKGGLRLAAAGATHAGDRLMGPGVSLVENSNGFAYMLCVMIPIYFYFFQQSKEKWLKYAWLFVAIASIFIVLKTGSRTGMLCLIGCAAFVIPKYLMKYKMVLGISATSLFLLWGSIGESNIERFKSIPQSFMHFFMGSADEKRPEEMGQDEQSAWERRMKNKHTKELIMMYPLFGSGMYTNDKLIPSHLGQAAGQVHCEILMAGKQMGIPGMLVYIGMIYVMFGFGWKVEKHCKGWWPEVSDLGWTIKVQGVIFAIGGSFSPLPFNIVMLVVVACGSSLWRLVQELPVPAADGRSAVAA